MKTSDEQWLKRLGKHIEMLIKEKGYPSVYDFWINKAGDTLSRASLNNLITGKKDFRISTIRQTARLLGVKTSKVFDFE